jgi:hypothetical protein
MNLTVQIPPNALRIPLYQTTIQESWYCRPLDAGGPHITWSFASGSGWNWTRSMACFTSGFFINCSQTKPVR